MAKRFVSKHSLTLRTAIFAGMSHTVFMIAFFLGTVLGAGSALPPPPGYHWTRGETQRFLIQRDPYFEEPKAAIEAVTLEGEYQPPIVERLTETVRAVAADGTATLLVTLAPEPGFEDEDHPQAAISRTVTVSASGRVLSVSGAALGSSPAEQDLLRGFVSISPNLRRRKDSLVVEDRAEPSVAVQSTSPDHDGTLLQTTQVAGTQHCVFDCRRGQLVRAVWTRTITLSLTMTGRGRRGSDDFGHVVPNSQIVQTLSVERRSD